MSDHKLWFKKLQYEHIIDIFNLFIQKTSGTTFTDTFIKNSINDIIYLSDLQESLSKKQTEMVKMYK
jgi:hypothetical protein